MPGKKKRIRMAVRKFAPFEAATQKLWDAYCRKTGCGFTLEAVPMDLHLLHHSILETGGLKSGDWDLAHMSTDWIMEARSAGAVENLQPYLVKNKPEDFPDGWSDSLLQMQLFEQEIIGLPFHDGPECLIYRKDLFEDPSEKKTFQRQFGKALALPETWEDFLTIATFFQRPDKNLYGTVFAAFPDGHNAVFDFCLQLWTRGGELMDDDGYININIPAAIEGLTFYRHLLQQSDAVHPGCNDYDSVKAGMAFARGEVAMMVNWFGFASFCEFSGESEVKGKIDVARIPHGPSGQSASLNSYWMYTIGKGSLHKELVYDFIKFAINKDNDKLLTLEGGIGCRIATWQDNEVNKRVPYYHKLAGLHQCVEGLPAVAEWPQIATIIDRVMLKTIKTGIPVSKILEEGQNSIRQIFNNNEYRL